MSRVYSLKAIQKISIDLETAWNFFSKPENLNAITPKKLGFKVLNISKAYKGEMYAGQIIEYTIAFPMNIGPGSYSISTALVSSDTHLVDNYEWRDLALVFTVANLDKAYFIGGAWIPPDIDVVLA